MSYRLSFVLLFFITGFQGNGQTPLICEDTLCAYENYINKKENINQLDEKGYSDGFWVVRKEGKKVVYNKGMSFKFIANFGYEKVRDSILGYDFKEFEEAFDLSKSPDTSNYLPGQLISIGSLKNGKKEGVWYRFNASGKINSIYYFNDDKKVGGHLGYYENGSLMTVEYKDENEKTIFKSEYYENGNPYVKADYVDGRLEGIYKIYWDNGYLRKIAVIDKGRINGFVLSFDRSGQLSGSNYYLDNEEYELEEGQYSNQFSSLYKLAEEDIKNMKQRDQLLTNQIALKDAEMDAKLDSIQLANLAKISNAEKEKNKMLQKEKKLEAEKNKVLSQLNSMNLKKFEEAQKMVQLEQQNQKLLKEQKVKDSLRQEQEKENLEQLNTTHQELISTQENVIAAEQKVKHNQRIFLGVAGGLLLLALIMLIFNIRSRRKIGKQKSEIENQHGELEKAHVKLEDKNTEIMDSITYAKRIQSAILPPQTLVREHLPLSFVLYKPKDIVAGDFYWMEQQDKRLLFAAADCTGHGVPGAMVSVVCNNGLNRAVREFGLTDPGKILTKTRDLVIQEFEKSEEEVKDGMDVALCSLSGNTLEFAGAHNPLWIIRKGEKEVEEYKADKQPIGKYALSEPFTTHKIILNEGDTFYIFSDGFADQFGGERGKKYKTKNFKRLLLSIQDKPISEHQQLLDNAFENWRGNIEQLDDVCVIGARI